MNMELNLTRNIFYKFNPFRVAMKDACLTVNFIYGYYCSILSGLSSRREQRLNF